MREFAFSQHLAMAMFILASVQAGASQSPIEFDQDPILGCNRGLHIQVHAIRSGDIEADPPAGHRWIELDLGFENRTQTDLIFELGYPELLGIDSLNRQLFLLVDGEAVYRVGAVGDGIEDSFRLPFIGAERRGAVTFPVPDRPLQSLKLYYFHDHFAAIEMTLLGVPDEPNRTIAEAADIRSNAVLDVSLLDFEFRDVWMGELPPEGMQWLIVDLRGQSNWTIKRPARAVAADAEAEARIDLPKVLEYLEGAGLLLALVDGRYAYPRTFSAGSLPIDPVFLPDRLAGGTAVFVIPEDAGRIELVTYFPEFRGENIGERLPAPERFVLLESDTEPELTTPLIVIADSPVPFSVESLSRTTTFGPLVSSVGEELLVLKAFMANDSETGGMMRVSHRARLRLEGSDDAVEAVAAFNRGPVSLVEPFWLPAGGEHRSFWLVYRVAEGARVTGIDYRGISGPRFKALDLP